MSTNSNPTDQSSNSHAEHRGSGSEITFTFSLEAIGRSVSAQLDKLVLLLTGRYLATYGIAVTRIILGVTALGILLSHFALRNYIFGAGSAWNREIVDPQSGLLQWQLFRAFNLVAGDPLLFTILYLILVVLSVLVILGWRSRIVVPIFAVLWVSFIEMNDSVGDQGDNAYRLFIMLLILTACSKRWSLDSRRSKSRRVGKRQDVAHSPWLLILLHNIAILALAVQVCIIYFSGGLYKAGGKPWQEGYAVYEPLQMIRFAVFPGLNDLLTSWGPLVVVISWGSIVLQIAFPFFLLNRYGRIVALFSILSFHLGIALLMGLPWFSLTMIAVDGIFIRDKRYESIEAFINGVLSPIRRSWKIGLSRRGNKMRSTLE